MNIDLEKLSQSIREKCPEVVFAVLYGSSRDGTVKPESDIDIAVYLDDEISFDTISKVNVRYKNP